jgi:hypothetical protein
MGDKVDDRDRKTSWEEEGGNVKGVRIGIRKW